MVEGGACSDEEEPFSDLDEDDARRARRTVDWMLRQSARACSAAQGGLRQPAGRGDRRDALPAAARRRARGRARDRARGRRARRGVLGGRRGALPGTRRRCCARARALRRRGPRVLVRAIRYADGGYESDVPGALVIAPRDVRTHTVDWRGVGTGRRGGQACRSSKPHHLRCARPRRVKATAAPPPTRGRSPRATARRAGRGRGADAERGESTTATRRTAFELRGRAPTAWFEGHDADGCGVGGGARAASSTRCSRAAGSCDRDRPRQGPSLCGGAGADRRAPDHVRRARAMLDGDGDRRQAAARDAATGARARAAEPARATVGGKNPSRTSLRVFFARLARPVTFPWIRPRRVIAGRIAPSFKHKAIGCIERGA